jgi:hypothetical protein
LFRLYAQANSFNRAWAAGKADIEAQGLRAQGARLVLGLMSRTVGREREVFQYLDEMRPEYNPASSWEHMAAERNVIIDQLTGKQPNETSSFIGQAISPKAEYYSWTTLADLRYVLSPDFMDAFRREYGRRVIAGYREAGKLNIGAMPYVQSLVG